MALTPDTRLGNCEIVAPLGAGGMSKVYRSRDPRLNGDVAVYYSAARAEADIWIVRA